MGVPSQDRLKVLIVDDDVDSVHSLCRLLTLMGYEVHGVANPRQVLMKVRELRPHVVVMDISMPEISGYELARALRNMPELKDLRLVALTGRVQPEDKERARQAGFDQHLAKPAALADVVEAIETVCAFGPDHDGRRSIANSSTIRGRAQT